MLVWIVVSQFHGQIVGIAIGAVVGAALIILLIVFLTKKYLGSRDNRVNQMIKAQELENVRESKRQLQRYNSTESVQHI